MPGGRGREGGGGREGGREEGREGGTVCYDTLFHETASRKEDKYLDLLSAIHNAGYNAGYNAKLITVEVGST